MEEEILQQLKMLNENLIKDFELRTEAFKLYQERNANEQELAEIALQEAEQQKAQDDLKEAKAEQRALQIEQFLKSLESEEAKEKEELSRQEMIQAINEVDNSALLTELSEKLGVIVERTEKSELQLKQEDLNYFNSRSLFMIIMFVVPCWLTVKYLGRLFDSASAF
ncbi:hypothetical protein [Enterococcus lemanii]|uniref:Uncharacterized protein n=1 Tax=Enterococcus lemanii TaxID=1159752 RepID=A0ABV9MWQ0_9ENTE|nr:hypothetical protein [Enterococcus lemanii]MBM7710429.1 multidrug efflux pump subunit AcrA (membrane-fusion protein) [Enterococcus lemanii]